MNNRTLLDVGLVRDDVDVDGHEEPEGSVAEGDGGEEFRPLVGRAGDPGPVGENHLELAADVLERMTGSRLGQSCKGQFHCLCNIAR